MIDYLATNRQLTFDEGLSNCIVLTQGHVLSDGPTTTTKTGVIVLWPHA